MEQMEHGMGHRLERKDGGGCIMLFGLPFFAVGVFMALNALGVGGAEMEEDTPRILFLLFGLVFGGVGAVLMFGRAGITIDRMTMKVTRWWGLLVPMKVTGYNLADFDRITIGKENRSSGNSSSTVYPVRLAGGPGVEAFEYKAPTDYQEARRLAEELARFLGHDIEDSSSGKTVHRRLDELDESVRDRMRRTRERVRLPGAPWEMKATIREEVEGTVIELPPPGLKPVHLAAIIPSLIFAGVVVLFFLRPLFGTGTPGEVKLIFGGFVVFFFIVVPVAVTLGSALRKARYRVKITVSQAMLRIEQGSGRKRKVTGIPGDELEEFELVGRKTKVIHLDGKLVLPGLIDAHGHFMSLGESLMQLDLRPQRSWEEIVDDVADTVSKTEPGEWIVGRGGTRRNGTIRRNRRWRTDRFITV